MKTLLLLFFATFLNAGFAEPTDAFNLRTSPIGLVLGPNLRLDYKIADQWTVGVGGLYLNRKITGAQIDSFTGSVLVDYAFNAAFADSWFVNLAIGYGNIRAEANDLSGQPRKIHVYNFTEQALLGYHWFWGSFNLDLAAGVIGNSAGHAKIVDQNGDKVNSVPLPPFGLVTDFSIGLTW